MAFSDNGGKEYHGNHHHHQGPPQRGLPRIPVQPVGWGAAAEILSRMTGPAVPAGWQGGLPFAYRLTGGPDLRVRLAVKQEQSLRRSANVIGVLLMN